MNNAKDRQLFDTIEKITQLDRKDRIFLWKYLKSMRGKSDGIIGDIPNNVKVNGTSEEFFKSLNDAYYAGTISLNDMFQGQVNMSDLPNDIKNAEVTIQVIEGLGGIPIFNVTLTTTEVNDNYSPYRWDYSSREGEFTEWYARAIGNKGGGSGADETIYLDNSDESKAKNLEVTAKYSTNQSVPVIVTDNNGLKCIGNYFNGIVTFVVDGALKIEDINFDTGEASSFASVDIDRIEEYTHLKIGDSAEVKSFNLERLKTGPQMCSIDYGFGVASWNNSIGGDAHITTAQGHEVYYIIGADGTVTKNGEITKDAIYQSLNSQQLSVFNKFYNAEVLSKEDIDIIDTFPKLFITNEKNVYFVKGVNNTIYSNIVYVPISDKEAEYVIISISGISEGEKPNIMKNVLTTKTDDEIYYNDGDTIELINGKYYISNEIIKSLTISKSSLLHGTSAYVYLKTGTTVPTITLPDGVKWANDDVPSFKANKIYELNFKLIGIVGTEVLIGVYAEYTL